MGRWTDRWQTDRQMVVQMDRWTCMWTGTDRQMVVQMDRQIDRQMVVLMDRQLDRWWYKWTDGHACRQG
jgi:hypothetical protein